MSLLTDASLLLTPNAYKEGKLYSVIPSNGNGDFTATRATTATRVNSAGLVDLVPYNLVSWSEMFTNAAWFKNNLTITANTITAPDGTLTADTATATTTGNCNVQFSVTPGGICTQSYYVKKNTARYAYIFRNSGITAGFIYDFDTNTISFSAGAGGVFTATQVGNGWVRLEHTTDMSFSGTLDLGFSSNPTTRTINSGESGYMWGAQVVQGTSARDYLRTETRLNIPRVDYSLGGCPNILLEPQRTNLALQSSSFDNATWTKFGSSVTANSTTSPSGIADADTLIESATNSTHLLEQSVAVTAVNHTLSCYVKAVSGSTRNVGILFNTTLKGVLLNPSTGAVVAYFNTTAADVSISNVGNGWFRVSVTALTAAITEKIRIYLGNGTTWTAPYLGDGTSGVYIWGAQLEAGAYATSFIPTTTASVTRNADIITRNNIFTNGLITAAGGTWFVELRNNVSIAREITTGGIFINTGAVSTTGNGFVFRNAGSASARMTIGKVESGTLTNLYTTLTDTAKVAIKWNGTTADVFVNGVKQVSATTFTTTAMQNLIADGINRSVFVNEMALFPTPLTDAQCIALTQ